MLSIIYNAINVPFIIIIHLIYCVLFRVLKNALQEIQITKASKAKA